MITMNISLPERLRRFVEAQIATGRFSSASEYVRGLIRDDQKRQADEQLQALMLEGLQRGESELTEADWAAIRQEAQVRLAAARNRG